jgi:RHS repeat-associated protein
MNVSNKAAPIQLYGGTEDMLNVHDILGRTLAEYTTNTSSQTSLPVYLAADSLGTPRAITNNQGAVISRHDYLPFGEEINAGTGGRTAAQGYVADNVQQKFTAKERDDETGLDYFNARYYASTQGRFTSIDPVFITEDRIVDPQQLNLYGYARSNPLLYTDPTGKDIVIEGGTAEQQEAIKNGIATLRAQSCTANKAFGLYDKEAGKGPRLTILILDDATFDKLKGVNDKTLAMTDHGGSIIDAESGEEIDVGAQVIIRASAIDKKKDDDDRQNQKETKVEGILSHEVGGHAKDLTTDPKKFMEQRKDQNDPNVPYEQRRNEVSADKATKIIGIERVAGGYVKPENLRLDLRFGKKLAP